MADAERDRAQQQRHRPVPIVGGDRVDRIARSAGTRIVEQDVDPPPSSAVCSSVTMSASLVTSHRWKTIRPLDGAAIA